MAVAEDLGKCFVVKFVQQSTQATSTSFQSSARPQLVHSRICEVSQSLGLSAEQPLIVA